MRHLVLLSLALAAGPVLAQNAPSLQACRAITDAAQRLACYDALPLPAPGTPAAATATTTAGPAAAPTAPDSTRFGLEAKAARSLIESIDSSIEGRFDGWGPKDRIRLANGQVWQIADDSTAALSVTNPKVTIRRGTLGVFYLEFEKSNRTARVRRVE
ncbi:MAG TPA: hypothetical protein VFY73_19695 [Ideonella sp.]|uniref:hypothetical protein n=1 Tax=Ideonella sp. TaxID=1929293 RepID=UPI002E312940|nr:hypothetical protein [Ideonella sp.]HEX5686259.1 hypothetical protein [Ideonella sp.]